MLKQIDQNTQEWLDWRKNGIGASDAPAVMNKSDYLTAYELWEIKTGKKENKPDEYITEIGHQVEAKIRALYELDCGKRFPPCLAEFEEYPFLKASLDGYCKETGEIIEIKMVGKARFESGELSEPFKIQGTHQMMITGKDHVTFLLAPTPNKSKGIKADKYKPVRYERDAELMKKVFQEELIFWECVQKNKPPERTEDEFIPVKDKALKKELGVYKKLVKKFDAIDKKKKQVEDFITESENKIKEMVKHKNTLCAGFEISKGTKAGAIDWKKFSDEHQEFNYEAYRKEDTETFKIKEAKTAPKK